MPCGGRAPASPDRGVRAPAVTSRSLPSVGHPHRKGHTHGAGATRTQDRRHRCLRRRWCSLRASAPWARSATACSRPRPGSPGASSAQPFEGAPDDNGTYGAGPGEPVELVVLGDSSAAGMGADNRYQTVGAIIATGVSALTGRPVRLTNTAVIGAESSGLELQLANALDQVARPHVAVIMVGANDVTHRIDKAIAVRHLETTVRRLRERWAPRSSSAPAPTSAPSSPIPQPLRLIGRRWSPRPGRRPDRRRRRGRRSHGVARRPARTRVRRAPARDVQRRPVPPLAGRLRPLLRRPCCPACMPRSACGRASPRRTACPTRRRGEGVGPVAVAAEHAVRDPGTEVSATEIAGQTRGPRGRWAMLLRRPRNPLPARRAAETGESRLPVLREAGTAAGRARRSPGPAAERSPAGPRAPGRRDQGHTRGPSHTAYHRG